MLSYYYYPHVGYKINKDLPPFLDPAPLDAPVLPDPFGSSKKKYAIILSYQGDAYYGLQINPNTITIDAELERALYQSGLISHVNYGSLSKIGWSRAARTDKGVHALSLHHL